MLKKIESLILHFVVVFVRRGLRYLLKRAGIVIGFDGCEFWFDDRCGLFDCIIDSELGGLENEKPSRTDS